MKYACLIIESGKVLEKDFTVHHMDEVVQRYPVRPIQDHNKVAEHITELQAMQLVNKWNRLHQAKSFLYWVL